MVAKAYPIQLEPNPFNQIHISAGFQVGDLLFLSGQVPNGKGVETRRAASKVLCEL